MSATCSTGVGCSLVGNGSEGLGETAKGNPEREEIDGLVSEVARLVSVWDDEAWFVMGVP
jgi:hypothetical protein